VDDEQDAEEEKAGVRLDYRQYYPTQLPMVPPGVDVSPVADERAAALPPDLATMPVGPMTPRLPKILLLVIK
jgi:hypothetical protein